MTKISLKGKKTFIIFSISLILAACIIIANYISIALLSTNSNSEEISSSEMEFFMLSLNKSQLEKEAVALAEDYQKVGAGGFVWENNGYFHILSSAYINKNDAQLKQTSIKQQYGIDCEIFSVKFQSVKIGGTFSNEEKKVISKSLSICETFYSSLFDISVSIDTGVYNDTNAKLSVNTVVNKINNIYANFDTLFPSPCPNALEELQNLQKGIVMAAKELSEDERLTPEQTYSSSLKYRYLQCLSLFQTFVKMSNDNLK